MKIQTLPSIILPTTPSTAASSSSTSTSLSLYENNYYQNFNTNNKNQLKYLLKDYQFTPFIVKPTYEEIYDCIVNENLKQLKKYVLDSFADQIYSWRNANIVTSIHTLNFIDSIPLMQKNITLLNNLIEKAAAATATTTINTTTTTTTTKTAKKITKSIKTIEWFLSNEPELFLSRNGLGITPLHQSILFRQYEIVTLIVKRLPITLDACDYQGRTPLHYAALLSDDHGQMYCRLVELGARTTVTDMYLRRPEDYLQIDSIDNINDQNNNNNNNSIIASTVKNFDEKIDKKLKNSIKTRRPSKLIIDTYNGNSSYNHDNVIKTSSNNELKLNHLKSSSPLRSSSSSSTSFLQPINDNQQNISLKTSTNLPIVSNGTQLSPTYDYYSKQDFDNSNNNRFQNKSANSIFRSRSPSPSQSPTTAKIIKTNNYYNSSMSNRLINVKEIIRQGNLSELEELVLNGYGDKLLGEIAYSSPLVQEFIDNLPNYLEQIDELHKSATRGNVKEFQSLLDRYSLICSRDPLGATPLHKAVLYNHYNLVKFIIINFGPNILYLGDNDKRTPLHYAAGLNDRSIYNLLLKYGPKAAVITDQYNHTADFYLRSPEELNIELIKKRSIRLNTNYSINLANKIKLLKSSSSPSPTVATTTFDFFQKQQHTSPFKRKQRSLSPNWNHYQSINTINNPNNNYNNNNEEYLNIEDYNSTIIINENMDTTTAPTTETIAGEIADESEYVIDNEIIDNNNNNNNNDDNTNNKQKQNSNNENNSNISNGNNSNTKQKMEVNSANLNKWIEENNIPMLEDIVLEGHGERLQQKASKLLLHKQKSNDHLFMTKDYIEKTVPIIMNKIKNIHHAVSMGDLTVLKKENLEKKRDYILSKDHLGMTPLHKATIMGHVNVVQYILDKFPETVNAKDHEGRTALHYSTATTNRNGIKIYKMLIKAGADSRVRDSQGKTPDYYRVHYLPIPNETLRPSGQTQSMNALNHIHSKIENSNQKHQRQQQKRHIIHPAIREKINNALHTGNVMHLEELLLDGYGQELIGRTSFDEDARKYLKSIPNQIERINELHQSIINGDDEQCKEILQKNPQFIRTKDQNSFTPFHLAVINGHTKLINFMCETFPNIVHVKDNMNRNALHLSALSGNGDIYRRLIEIGFDPKSIDQKGKTAEYYLRNNAAITPTELSELLALSSTATTPIPSLSTHNPRTLTKLSKAPALTTTTTTSNSSSSTTPTTNADNSNIINTGNNIMTSSAKKLGAKPSRLPALHNNKLEKQSTKSIDDESSIEAKDKEPAETEPSAPAAEQAKEEKNVIQEARKSSSTSVKSINNNDDINANNVDNINDNNNNNDTLNVTSNDDGKDSNVDNKNGDGVDDDKIKENVDDDNSPKTNETLIDVESKNNNNNNETNDNVVAADDNDDKQQQQQQQKDDTNVNKNEEFINVASGEENLLQNNNNNDNNDDNVNVDDDKINTLTVEQLDVNNDNNNSNNDNENIGNNNNDEGNNLSPKTNEDKVVANDNKMVNESNINDNNKSENDGVINQTEDSNDYKNDDNEIEQQSEKEPVIIYSRIDQEKIIENYESLWTNIENGDGLDDENNNNNNNDNLNENSEKIENNTDNNGKDEEKPIDDKRSDIVDDGDANNNNNNNNNDTDKDDKNGDNNNNKIKDKSISVIKEEDEEDQDEDERENGNVENKNENNGDNNEIESSSLNKQENIDEKNEPDAKIEAKNEQSSADDNQQQDLKTDSDIIGTDSNKNQLNTNQADDDDDAKRQKQQSMMTIDTNLIDENVDDPKGKNENDDENESKNNNNSNVMNDDERQQQQQQQQQQEMEPILNQIDTTNENQNKAETLEIKDDDDNNANTNTNANNNNNDNSVLNEKNDEKISDTVNNDDNNNNNNNNGNNEINSNNRDEKNMDDKNIKPSSSNVDDDDGSKSQSKNQDIMAEAAENVDEQKSKSELQNDSSIDDDVNTTAAAAAAKEPNEKKNDDLNEFNEEKLQKMIDGSTTKRTISARTNVPDMNHDRLNELIKGWLEDGDLIRLEHVVIAGQGHRLLNIQSENKQVQDFLNLVPHYMDKIRKIHDLVIKGNFDEIEKTLTRKRFALCRDKYGNSPLHLSVLHGHIDILLYIITQFPETIDGPDNDGRTPLHYAAVLPDKQIYQILETAGANKKQTDRHGYTPVDYLTNGKLTIRDLLIKYKNDKNNISSSNNNDDNNDSSTKADLWERPPTSEIVSQLTPESGSVPSSANGDNSQQQRRPSTIDLMNEAGKNSLMPKANNDDDESTVNDDNNKKDVQILQIEPRELKDEPSMNDNEFMSTESNEVDNNSDNDNDSTRTVIIESSTKSPIKNQSPIDDKVFENLSNEFNQTLRNEKLRLRESIDQQIENSDVIKNGQSGSIIDSIQSAAEAKSLKISNGLSAAGYDLTQIKDEHGRTVLHLAAAKDQKRNTFYKMLQQARYLVPELDSKYRTIRDIAVQNGIKNNLQVIDQFIIDSFLNEDEDYLRLLLLEGYSTLLTVVDSEGNDIISLLKRNNKNKIQTFIHEAAELQKMRDELHTFIRNGYMEGVVDLIENNSQLVLAKSNRGRTSLHLAVLFGNLNIIEKIIKTNPKVINVPDNLGRTPLHYAMAMSKMEEMGTILINSGADKAIRDVRMRMPSYYFVYKQDIRDIKREEQNLTI